MSHDAVLVLAALGSVAALVLAGWLIVVLRRAVSHVGRTVREVVDTWKSLVERSRELEQKYDSIKLRQNDTDQETFKELVTLKEALFSIDGQFREFAPKYLESGKPLEAVPPILNAQIAAISELRTTVRSLQRTLTGDGGGNYQEPDDQRDQAEDEIQKMMSKVGCDRSEAVSRLEDRKLWGRLGNLTGTDNE